MQEKVWWVALGLVFLTQGPGWAAEDPLVSWETESRAPRRVTRGSVISSFEPAPAPVPSRLRQYDIEEEALPLPPVEVRVELQ